MFNKRGASQRALNKPFWVILLLVFFISSTVVVISSLDSSSLTGNAAVQIISFAPENSNLVVEVRNVEGIAAMDLHFKDTIKNAKIFIDEIPTLRWQFVGTAYTQFEVSSLESEKIDTTIYTLKLKEDRLKELKLAPKEVKLYLEGEELITNLEKTEGGYVYYSATAERMGQFVIGKMIPTKEPIPVIEQLKEKIIEEALVGKATETPQKENFFSKIGRFFRNLFG